MEARRKRRTRRKIRRKRVRCSLSRNPKFQILTNNLNSRTRNRLRGMKTPITMSNSNSWKEARRMKMNRRERVMKLMNGSSSLMTTKRMAIKLNKMILRLSNLNKHPEFPKVYSSKRARNCKRNISIKLHKCQIRTRNPPLQEAPQDKWVKHHSKLFNRPTLIQFRFHLQRRQVSLSHSSSLLLLL